MKKTLLTLLLMISLGSLAMSQQHRCGTMDYYALRLKQDPGLAQRMLEQETYIREWIKEHPQPVPVKDQSVKFPVLPGFTLTGNPVTDRQAYQVAKETYMASHPVEQPGKNQSEEEKQTAKLQHRVTIIYIPNKSK